MKVPWTKANESQEERIPTPPGFKAQNPKETTYQTTSDLQWTIVEKNGYVYVRKLKPNGRTAWKLKIKPPDV